MTTSKGAKPFGSGRKPGSLNKATASVRAEAQKFTSEAIDVLVAILRGSLDDRCKLAAATTLLDRAHGRPPAEMPQAVKMQVTGTFTEMGRSVFAAVAGGTLGPGDGARLVASIAALAKLADIDELAGRIIALEKHYAGK